VHRICAGNDSISLVSRRLVYKRLAVRRSVVDGYARYLDLDLEDAGMVALGRYKCAGDAAGSVGRGSVRGWPDVEDPYEECAVGYGWDEGGRIGGQRATDLPFNVCVSLSSGSITNQCHHRLTSESRGCGGIYY